MALLAIVFSPTALALDYVIVVDTSGSMLWSVGGPKEKISPQNPQRIQIVRRALTEGMDALPEDSRLTMIEFNTGVKQVSEFDFSKTGAREEARRWIAQLTPPPSGDTHLWAATRKAFQAVRRYLGGQKGKSVVVRIYTDGENDDKSAETGKLDLTQVLAEFPEVDGTTLRPDLVLLSRDLKMEVKAKMRADAADRVRIIEDPSFTVPFPPTILWSPKPPVEGQPVSFFENSKSPYKAYEWVLDGRVAGKDKVLQVPSLSVGSHTVQLKVTHLSDIADSKTANVEVVAPMVPPPDAAFTAEPQVFKVGEPVALHAKATQPGLKHEWLVGGNVRLEGAEATWKGDRTGTVLVVHRITGPSGSSEASLQVAGIKPETLPVVRFTADPTRGRVPLDVQFKDQTTLSETVARYEWDFGDASPVSNDRHPTHRFDREGEYTVRLKVTTTKGDALEDAEPVRIEVQPPPPPPPWWYKWIWPGLGALLALVALLALWNKLKPEPLYGTIEWQFQTQRGKRELSGRSLRLRDLGIAGWTGNKGYVLRNRNGEICLCVDGLLPAPWKKGVSKTLDGAVFTFRSTI